MEIKIGDYIRTKGGYIQKILEIQPYYENDNNISEYDYISTETLKQWKRYQLEKIVKKNSKNIIDLIEEDDIVNEEFVDKIKEDEDGKYIKTYFNNVYRNKDIESIVTKEQFESIAYKLEREKNA